MTVKCAPRLATILCLCRCQQEVNDDDTRKTVFEHTYLVGEIRNTNSVRHGVYSEQSLKSQRRGCRERRRGYLEQLA